MSEQIKILLLEDNKSDVELLRLSLRSSSLNPNIKEVDSKPEFANALRDWQPNLIISDYSLPGYDGRSALTLAKAVAPNVPFIFYSGTIGEEAAIESLKLGANDYVLKDKPKRLISAIGRALDDAEQRRRQRESDERIKGQAQLLDLATDAIIVRDMEDRIVFWNSGAEAIYGSLRSEVLGRHMTEFVAASSINVFREAKEITIRDGKWQGELEHVTKAGRRIDVMCRWTLVRTDLGEPHQILSIKTDITEKKQLERQFLRAQRLESVGTLASGIAHDLNNVLVPVMMASDVLKDVQPTKDALDMVTLIKSSAERGAAIVKQLLTFVRGGDGKRAMVDVALLIKEIAGVARKTFPKHIKIGFEIEPGLRLVSADPTQLHQVLMNLCINARDAMPHGGNLLISASNSSDANILIEVNDTGTGMPADVLERIFDPFFTTKEPDKGTGLGLSTTMGIVKTHGGKLSVESQLGVGTVFRVILPAALESTNTDIPPRGRGEVILVAHDQIAARKRFSEMLSEYGYEVRTAHDAAAAVGTLARYSTVAKVLITHTGMRTDTNTPLTRVAREMVPEIGIIVTATSDDPLADEKADRILKEPFTPFELLRGIAEIRVKREASRGSVPVTS
jgi:two-component system cell cycle sensor histidine kinase/response regulator CckA